MVVGCPAKRMRSSLDFLERWFCLTSTSPKSFAKPDFSLATHASRNAASTDLRRPEKPRSGQKGNLLELQLHDLIVVIYRVDSVVVVGIEKRAGKLGNFIRINPTTDINFVKIKLAGGRNHDMFIITIPLDVIDDRGNTKYGLEIPSPVKWLKVRV